MRSGWLFKCKRPFCLKENCQRLQMQKEFYVDLNVDFVKEKYL